MRIASWLRFQLAGVILIGLLPIAALISFLGYQDRRSAIEHATEFIIRASESAVGAQSRIIDSSRTLLGVLARLPLALHPESPECGALLSAIKTDQPRYANLGIVDPDGNILCSALPMAHPFSAADRSWFQRAMQSADFTVGDYQVGRITGKASLNVALPAKDADGRIASVVFAALDLDWLAEIIAGAELPPGGSFTLIDSEGTVLARYPEPERWIGRSVAETPLFEAIRRRDSGSSFEAVGLDGRKRLYNVVRLGDADAGSRVYASIGVPTEEIVAEANRDLTRGLGGVGALGLLLFLSAYVAGDRLITKPMRKLVDLSRRIAGGDFTARSELDHGGGEIGQLAQSLDSMVAALEKREKDLRESESRLRAFMDNAPVLMIVEDLEGRIVMGNKGIFAAFGALPESVLGRRSADFLRPDHAALIAEHERLVLETGEAVAREMHFEDRPGMEWSYEVKFPLHDADGRINAIAGVIVDITDRKGAEEALRQSERRFRHLVESTNVIPSVYDVATQRVTYIGPQGADMLGYSAADWSNEGFWLGHLHPDDREALASVMSSCTKPGDRYDIEYRMMAADGGTVWMRDTVKIEAGEDGRAMGYGLTFDITETKSREQQLAQAQKMESVGQLTGGVAHDFNNLLTVIMGSLEMAEGRAGEDPRLRSALGSAMTAAGQAADLIRQLMAFARQQPLQPQALDLDRVVAGMTPMLRRTLGEHIEIEVNPSAGLHLATADRTQLENALLNLAINARDAMSQGGKLTLETANVHLDSGYAARNAEVTPGDYAMLAISDSGVGMPPEVIERAFEPFFTTKGPGKGTGLGLSMVYGFVKQSGGHLKIYSEVGHGTTMRLYLPNATALEASAEAQPLGAGLPRGDETVLVVEDDTAVRELVVSQLAGLGYAVLQAPDGPAAEAVLEGGAAVDLLFTDIVMPGGMTGRQLADRARRRRPGLKVLFTSGYAENAVVHQGRLDPGVHLLSKPYKKLDLARKVRDALDGPAAA
ncbi:MAG: PAS domain S-box protein [Dongiaceae bacterium]